MPTNADEPNDTNAQVPESAAQQTASTSSGSGTVATRLAPHDIEALASIYDRRPRWLWRFVWLLPLVALISLAALWTILEIREFLSIAFAALFISFGIEPAVNWLQDHGWKRGLATAAVFVAVLVIIGVFIPLLLNVAINEGEKVESELPEWISEINDLLHSIGLDTTIRASDISSWFESLDFGSIGGEVFGVAQEVLGSVIFIFMIVLLTIYLVLDGPRLRRTICRRLPQRHQQTVLDLWELSIRKTGGYVGARSIILVTSFITAYVAMLIASFMSSDASGLREAAIPMAIFYGLSDAYVPVVGAYIGGFLPVLITLIAAGPLPALFVVAFIIVEKQFSDYLLSPKIEAHTMKINPAIAISAVFVGAEAMGITGALISVPIVAIVQGILSTVLGRHDLIENKLVRGGPIEEDQRDEETRYPGLAALIRRRDRSDADTGAAKSQTDRAADAGEDAAASDDAAARSDDS